MCVLLKAYSRKRRVIISQDLYDLPACIHMVTCVRHEFGTVQSHYHASISNEVTPAEFLSVMQNSMNSCVVLSGMVPTCSKGNAHAGYTTITTA